jgi:hypothetical protein
MMRRTFVLLAAVALYAGPAAAQSSTPSRDGRGPGQSGVSIGLGVGVEPQGFVGATSAGGLGGDVTTGGFAPVGIYVPIQIGPALRIEPVIGFWHAGGSRAVANNGETYSASATTLGVGALFFLSPPQPVGIYAGARLALNFQSASQAAGGGTTVDFKETDFSIAPVLGGEFAFAQRFSVGAEVQLPISWYGNPSSDAQGVTVTVNNDRTGIRTNAVIFLRYFFM